jgi:hypothetical protein
MAITIIDDTFTGAAAELSTHVGNLGEIWTKVSGENNSLLSGTGSIYATASSKYIVSNKRGITDHHTISLKLNTKSALATFFGFLGWADATLANGYLIFGTQAGTGNWQLHAWGQTPSAIPASAFTYNPVDGDVLSLELSPGSQIVRVNGVLKVSTADTRITSSPATQYFGFWNNGAAGTTPTTGLHYDQFSVVDNDAPALANAAPTISSQTKTSVTVASHASGGVTPYTYAWHASATPNFTPDGSTLIAGQTGVNLTLAVTAARRFVRNIATDAQSTAVTSYQRTVESAKDNVISVARIGDSTSDLPTGATCIDYAILQLRTQGGFTDIIKINKSVGGTSTTEWLPGTAAMNAFDASITAATTRVIVSIGLGVNDAQFHHSSSLYISQLTTIINHVLGLTNANGDHPLFVVVDYPTWREPGFYVGATTFDEVYSTFIFDYCTAIDTIINGATIVAGNKTSLDLFAEYPTTYMDLDGGPGQVGFIHPNAAGAEAMGFEIAHAILNRLYPPGSGGMLIF